MKTRMELWEKYREEIDKNIDLRQATKRSNEELKILYKNLLKVYPNYESEFEKLDLKLENIQLDDIEILKNIRFPLVSETLDKIRSIENFKFPKSITDELNFSSEEMQSIITKLKNSDSKDMLKTNTGKMTSNKTKFMNLQKTDKIQKIRIAIDGPSGSGKTTIARELAKRLEYKYISTGLVYRAIAYNLVIKSIDAKNKKAIIKSLEPDMIKLLNDEVVLLYGKNITFEVKNYEISQLSSKISTIPEIRNFAIKLQKKYGEHPGIIMDGRDTAINIIPDAELKIYLDTLPQIRAKRRMKQNEALGETMDLQSVLHEIEERDNRDTARKTDPLRKAPDAILIDSSYLTIEECVDKILDLTYKIMNR